MPQHQITFLQDAHTSLQACLFWTASPNDNPLPGATQGSCPCALTWKPRLLYNIRVNRLDGKLRVCLNIVLCEHETQIVVRRSDLPRHITILSWLYSRRGWRAKNGPTKSCSPYGNFTKEAMGFRMIVFRMHATCCSKQVCGLADCLMGREYSI